MKQENITKEQREALQKIRDQHTDKVFPECLNELLKPSWERLHILKGAHRTTFNLKLSSSDAGYADMISVLLHGGSAVWVEDRAHLNKNSLTEVIDLLTEARDSL